MQKSLVDTKKKYAKILLSFSIISFVISIFYTILMFFLTVNNVIYKHLLPSKNPPATEEDAYKLVLEILFSLLIPAVIFLVVSLAFTIITIVYRIKLMLILDRNKKSDDSIWIMILVSFFIAGNILMLISSISILSKKLEIPEAVKEEEKVIE
ncbi:hypothetical protein ACJA25_02910 [Mycoplasmopsis hyopharyngis]|uniref:hypothetical protein n=1 Tax=Mycoplasmopsis hyopharyngis TaxID=29558 RepID=UPI003873BB4C